MFKCAVNSWILFLFVAQLGFPLIYGCEKGWFGPKCQYQCHCSDNSCNTDGLCEKRAKCVPGWFGPACQYVDLARSEHVVKGGSVLSTIADGDESTCLSGSLSNVTVTWKTPTFVTWLRFHIKTSESLRRLTVSFKKENDSPSTPCMNRRNISVSDTAMDVYCDVTETTKQVIITGQGVKSLCSLYISGGRNVALKGNTTQSSTDYEKGISSVSSNAVNGDNSGAYKKGQCSSTALEGDKQPNLNLTFKTPVTVNRIVLHNRRDTSSRTALSRLRAFILRSFNAANKRLFRFQDEDKKPRHLYTVNPPKPLSNVSWINVEATTAPYDRVKILTLCELEVFGDLVCPARKFGLGCERKCRCADKSEQCAVSTGGCVSGCAARYSGEGCQDKKA